jgi:uncharacterized protein (DUF302 family)
MQNYKKITSNIGRKLSSLAMVLISLSIVASAADTLKPFELAFNTTGDIAPVVTQVEQKLAANGFEVVGTYAPYTNLKFSNGETVSAEVIGITNPALKQAAAETPFGGFAAVQRVTVTKVNDQIQVAYTNPTYMANAYRLKTDLAGVNTQLAKALGAQSAYGSKNGLTASSLQNYHYKMMMPYFTDLDTLAQYPSYQKALDAVNIGLAAHKGGTTKVYQVAIPGKEQSLFGVGLSGAQGEECAADGHIMGIIDGSPVKSTGHLSYEILVSGGTVYALPAKFRIAINFPDLSMMGPSGFMAIRCAPGAIEASLKDAYN